jgi:tRNA G10  N-methylase Trm11
MVTPYYQGERATLYLGDCRDVVPTLPRQSVDLIVADPPYGMSWQSGRRQVPFEQMAGDDGTVDWPSVIGNTMRHLLRNERHIYVFGYKPEALTALPVGAMVEGVWDKVVIGAGPLTQPWGPQHESITFGVYNWSRVNRAKGSGRLAARLRQGFVLHVPRPVSRQVRHPAEKPVELVRQLIESSSCLGETVFDPTCGVGSVPVAAVLAGRHAIGIESDDRYLSIAVDRLREAERIAKLAEVC